MPDSLFAWLKNVCAGGLACGVVETGRFCGGFVGDAFGDEVVDERFDKSKVDCVCEGLAGGANDGIEARGEEVLGVAFCRFPRPKGLGESAALVVGNEKAGAAVCPNPSNAGLGPSAGFGVCLPAFSSGFVNEACPNPEKGLLAAFGISLLACCAPKDHDGVAAGFVVSALSFETAGAKLKADLAGAKVVRGVESLDISDVFEVVGAGEGDPGGDADSSERGVTD